MTQPKSEAKYQKFLFHSRGVALSGTINKPYFQELGSHAVVETAAGSSGRITARSERFRLVDDVRYEDASSEIVARQRGSICQSVLIVTVEGFKIRDILSVDKVVCRMESIFDTREYPKRLYPRILPTGSHYENLVIKGKRYEPKLHPAFTLNRRQQHDFFAGKYDDNKDFFPGYIPDPLPIPGVGTINFAEWTWVHPAETTRQRLAMLRISLGSGFGAAMTCASGKSDGAGWPPLVGL